MSDDYQLGMVRAWASSVGCYWKGDMLASGWDRQVGDWLRSTQQVGAIGRAARHRAQFGVWVSGGVGRSSLELAERKARSQWHFDEGNPKYFL